MHYIVHSRWFGTNSVSHCEGRSELGALRSVWYADGLRGKTVVAISRVAFSARGGLRVLGTTCVRIVLRGDIMWPDVVAAYNKTRQR